MTGKTKKIYKAIMIYGNFKNKKFDDVCRLVKAYGYLRKPAKTGDHVKFFHPEYPDLPLNLQPIKGGQAKPYQVEQVRDTLMEIERREKNKK